MRLAIWTWAEHLDDRRSLRMALTLAGVVLVVYPWLTGAAGMMLGSAVLGVALGSVQPMVLSMLHQAAPPNRQGQALALRMLFTNAATITMPIGFGFLAVATTTGAPMWLMAALVMAAHWPARQLLLPAAAARPPDKA